MDTPALALVLHAHLPYVRHPEHPTFLEENWLFEAITECYLPLLAMLRRLSSEEIPTPLAINLSPTLCEMLFDDLLQDRYRNRLHQLCELSEKELDRTSRQPNRYNTAVFYYERLLAMQTLYEEELQGDLLSAFAALRDNGLEILASAATHPVLPLIANEACQRAQIHIGVERYRRQFDADPVGFWLPECAYMPGLDNLLAEEGIRYFFLDAHGVIFARPRPVSGIFAPVDTPNGVACFARDAESAKQVWSAGEGYPGDPVYREYYRDLGHDAAEDYIRPYLFTDTDRHNVGVKYHRVTGNVPLDQKETYSPIVAMQKAREHAAHFVAARITQTERLGEILETPPVFVAPYDAELFGHWWYEGPVFLEEVLRLTNRTDTQLHCATPTAILDACPQRQTLQPSASSWGYNGYFETWLSGVNDWIYPDLHAAELTMLALAETYEAADSETRQALDLLGRELLLAQASDWPFILMTGTMPDYARKRIKSHLNRFEEIAGMIRAGDIDTERINALHEQDNIFSWAQADLFTQRSNQ